MPIKPIVAIISGLLRPMSHVGPYNFKQIHVLVYLEKDMTLLNTTGCGVGLNCLVCVYFV